MKDFKYYLIENLKIRTLSKIYVFMFDHIFVTIKIYDVIIIFVIYEFLCFVKGKSVIPSLRKITLNFKRQT